MNSRVHVHGRSRGHFMPENIAAYSFFLGKSKMKNQSKTGFAHTLLRVCE
jgi:hypothetical protein